MNLNIAFLLALLMMAGYGWFEHHRYVETKSEYDGFIAKAQILAAERLAENKRKEVEYAERLKTAEFTRDRLLRELRQRQASSDLPRVPFLPATATSKVCFDRAKLESAIGSFVKDIQGITTEGDIALIDLQTVLAGWPQ